MHPNRAATAAPRVNLGLTLGVTLGIASGSSCWLVIFCIPALSGTVRYLPGAILGALICIAGQAILGWPRVSLTRLCALILSTMLAWRLAQFAQALGGPLRWFSASLLGTLGACAGMLLAWPVGNLWRRLLLATSMVGGCGGVLFTVAGMLHLYGGKQIWALVLLCSWHGALLTAAGLCLHRAHSSAVQPALQPPATDSCRSPPSG